MSDSSLHAVRDMIQEDINQRGLRASPHQNLINSCFEDFPAACRHMAATSQLAVGIVTGFFIPAARPPAAETDGPLGALFLARVLVALGAKVLLATDDFCIPALDTGLVAAGLTKEVHLIPLPSFSQSGSLTPEVYCRNFFGRAGNLTHLIALERAGPSHTLDSLRTRSGASDSVVREFLAEVPSKHHDRCHTMSGRDITVEMSPAHFLFENTDSQTTTIGIGDGGNEIGMGKIPWFVIRDNIPGGAVIACRIPADFLIVCGISNWGAYGLAAAVAHLRRAPLNPAWFDPEEERRLLQLMVEKGPLVDGVTAYQTLSVDGVPFDRYVQPLQRMSSLLNPA
jgi:hypothetical protein